MPTSRLTEIMTPNTTKPPITPPAIAAMLDRLSEGTKGVCACVYVSVCVYDLDNTTWHIMSNRTTHCMLDSVCMCIIP